MAFINDRYADVVQQILSAPLADSVRVVNPSSRERLADAGTRFEVGGSTAPVEASTDDPVVDYGGRHPNESHVATPIVNLTGSDVGQVISDAIGYQIESNRSAALLYAHTFIDAGASRWAGGLVSTTCPAVLAISFRPSGNDVDVVLVDGNGARVLVPATGPLSTLIRRSEQGTTPRANLSNADADAVYATSGTNLLRAPVRSRTPQLIPYQLGDGLLVGAHCDRLTLTRSRNLANVGTVTQAEQRQADPPANVRARAFLSSISRITDISDSPWRGGADAPAGYIWGNPMGTGNCSRNSRDNCLGCCDNILLGYTGAAVTSLASGVAIGASVAGVGAIPGTIVGGVIGLFIMGAGAVHSALCRNDCSRLYDFNNGRRVDRQSLQLTAAAYADGQQVAYEVSVESGAPRIVWGADRVIEMSWSGIEFTAMGPSGNAVPVSVVRGPSAYYLRSYRNRSREDNLGRLPPIT